MPLATTAASSRSPRYFGKITPFDGAPTWWPARPTRCRPRATLVGDLDLDDEVDRAHVDAQLEAAGRDEGRQAAGLELLLDRDPLLAGDRSVVGSDELLAGEVVEALGEPLGEATAIGEDDRAAMGLDQLEDGGVDRRPDAGPRLGVRGRAAGLLVQGQDLAGRGHVLDRDDDLELERLAGAGIDDRHLATRPDAAEEPGDRLERPLGGAEPDPLRRTAAAALALARCDEPLEALQAQRKVRAAFRAGDRVDLVDDDVLDAAEDVAGLAGEHEIERLGRRDEDVRRAAGEVPAVLRGRVAGPAGDGDVRRRFAESGGGQADAGQRRPEVPLDVVGQGLERRDVEDPDACRAAPWSAASAAWRRGGRGSRGTRRGSCRCRSGRGSTCDARPRSPPSPPPGPASAPRMSPRTRPERRG